MSDKFPTDAEREVLVNHAAWWNDGEPDLRTDDLIEELRPLVAAREAAAKAEALREAAVAPMPWDGRTSAAKMLTAMLTEWLRDRADRIEREGQS